MTPTLTVVGNAAHSTIAASTGLAMAAVGTAVCAYHSYDTRPKARNFTTYTPENRNLAESLGALRVAKTTEGAQLVLESYAAFRGQEPTSARKGWISPHIHKVAPDLETIAAASLVKVIGDDTKELWGRLALAATSDHMQVWNHYRRNSDRNSPVPDLLQVSNGQFGEVTAWLQDTPSLPAPELFFDWKTFLTTSLSLGTACIGVSGLGVMAWRFATARTWSRLETLAVTCAGLGLGIGALSLSVEAFIRYQNHKLIHHSDPILAARLENKNSESEILGSYETFRILQEKHLYSTVVNPSRPNVISPEQSARVRDLEQIAFSTLASAIQKENDPAARLDWLRQYGSIWHRNSQREDIEKKTLEQLDEGVFRSTSAWLRKPAST